MDVFFREAVNQARKSLAEGGIPVGSVLAHDDKILGAGHNCRIQGDSVIRHGEMDALEDAGRLPSHVYRRSVIYTTLSPCSMCSGAILLYGIPKVVIGENQNFLGAEDWLEDNGVEILVLQDRECIELMNNFIRDFPRLWHEDIGL